MGNRTETRKYESLFLVFVSLALWTNLILEISGVLNRAELQTIDQLFETRRWLLWNSESLPRLNLPALLSYHDKHEIPRQYWAWDYTLSWLIEPNHPPVMHKFVIFNHLQEDEPPLDALEETPWIKPLLQHPISRSTVANMVEFLASSGARLIVLDSDFPQYSADDAVLARAIHRAASGETSGHPVRVLMASTVQHRTILGILQSTPSSPDGILRELEKLEPGTDVQAKYTGMSNMVLDEDHVLRRTANTVNSESSILVKAIDALGEDVPKDLPDIMDIDFVGPPNSQLYPVRPLSYLLNPELKMQISNPEEKDDVTLANAIVFIGDGIVDVHPTPYTNLGVNLMSGAEVLAQTLDTISRKSWHFRLNQSGSFLYFCIYAVAGGIFYCAWNRFRKPPREGTEIVTLVVDLLACLFMISLSYVSASFVFTFFRLIPPVVTPAVSLTVASLATVLWDRQQEQARSLRQKLAHAVQTIDLQQQKHEAELKQQEAEARAQEFYTDQTRRREFVRRINHDLKAPVTTLCWTLARLKKFGFASDDKGEKVDKLVRTADRLVDLLHELARDYDAGVTSDNGAQAEVCELNQLITDSATVNSALAEMKTSRITVNLPEQPLLVKADKLSLGRVFDNMIRNAIIHNQPGTEVSIEAQTIAHTLAVTITDNGEGIKAEKLEEILKNLDGYDDVTEDGRMGLKIATTFVESIGGKMSIRSDEAGTCITITLPDAELKKSTANA